MNHKNRIIDYIKKPENIKHIPSSGSFLTIDIGSDEVKIMEVSRKGISYFITRTISIPGMQKFYKGKFISNRKSIVETIVYTLQKEKIKTKNIFLLFSSDKTQSKVIQLPKVNPKELKGLMTVEFQKNFPNSDQSTDVFDFMEVGTAAQSDYEELTYILALCSVYEASELINEFKKKKYFVKYVDADSSALRNLAVTHKKKVENKAIIDLGHEFSKAIFIKKNDAVFSRDIEYGSDKILKHIQNELQVTSKKSEDLLFRYGLVADEDLILSKSKTFPYQEYNRIIEESFTSGINELSRALQYLSTNLNFQTEEVIIAGGLGNLVGTASLVEKVSDLPSHVWSMSEGEKISLPKGLSIVNNSLLSIDSSFAVCFGMALREAIK